MSVDNIGYKPLNDDSLLDWRNKKFREAMECEDQDKMAEKMDRVEAIGNYLVEKMKSGLLGQTMDENGEWAWDVQYEKTSGGPGRELFCWLVSEIVAIQKKEKMYYDPSSLIEDRKKHLFDFFEKFKRGSRGSRHSLACSRDLTKKLATVLKNGGFSPEDAEKVKKVLAAAEAEEKALWDKARPGRLRRLHAVGAQLRVSAPRARP